ncbi:MAG: SDR family NAD(P)-dependent oxidoreductase [Bacteroidia bacterium]|nr:SDR family NAD(P)-dependent oxidoreductase [Bacteroidia bacterium]MCC6768611.1 SDR family NAD(P)-dependent oxidoreductase [Bacteroidia bacterium]
MGDNKNKNEKVWFITGCSTGLGHSLAQCVLKAGYKVVVTAREKQQIQPLADAFPGMALLCSLDVTNKESIEKAVSEAITAFGRIDFLVNNAGIGYFAAIEESEEPDYRRMFEVNFFGLHDVTKAILPLMRKQRGGHILNVSSIAGFAGFPAVGFYNATKFAVQGYSESLAKETAHLGIRVTIVSPSGFRTDWAGRSAKSSPVIIEDYLPSAGANKQNIRNSSGKQAGDPQRAAEAILRVCESPNPPLHLLLGSAALKNVRLKLDNLKSDIDTWEATSAGADYQSN